ncbi:MAG: hypothetical protein AAGG81_06510 [Chlamydiota bacterium]
MFKKITIFFAVACFVGLQLNANEEIQVDCSKNLLLSYFPESVVNEVLGDYRVPQNLWPAINADLAEQDTIIVNIVDQKSRAIQQNSAYDVRQKDVVVGIYRETLYEVFAETLKKYGIDRKAQAEAMLDQIQYKKGKLFKECMQSKQKTLELQPEVGD